MVLGTGDDEEIGFFDFFEVDDVFVEPDLPQRGFTWVFHFLPCARLCTWRRIS